MILQLLAIIGFFVSIYAIIIERKASRNSGIKLFCDLNDRVSCSKVLTSKYAKMTGVIFRLRENHLLNVPNTYYGVVFYFAVFVYGYVDVPYKQYLLFVASIVSIMACFVLAIAMYKMGTMCTVCISTYFINLMILYGAWIEIKKS